MSFKRKLKRNETVHTQLKCRKCGTTVKFYKWIKTINGNKYHNVFVCPICKATYQYKKGE